MIDVAAGILRDASGRVLIAERKGDASFTDHWEFPGGKLDKGESARAALRRELDEELGIEVLNARHFRQLEHVYPDRAVRLDFFIVHHWHGSPVGRIGQRLRWSRPGDVQPSMLLPADAPLLAELKETWPD